MRAKPVIWITAIVLVVIAGLFLALPNITKEGERGKENSASSSTSQKGNRPRPPTAKSKRNLDFANIGERNGLIYEKDEDKPFTGTVEDEHSSGEPRAQIPVQDGVLHGTMKRWDEQGTLRLQASYDRGTLVEVKQWDRFGKSTEVASRSGDPYRDLRAEHANREIAANPVFENPPRAEEVPPDSRQVISISNLRDKNGITYRADENVPFTGQAQRERDDGSRWEQNFQNGRRHGEFRSFYPNGQLRSQENYVNGIKDGFYSTWYENGRRRFEAEIENGRQVGVKSWNTEGTIISHWESGPQGEQIDLLNRPAEPSGDSPAVAPTTESEPGTETP